MKEGQRAKTPPPPSPRHWDWGGGVWGWGWGGGGELLQVLLKYIISHQQEICRCFEKGCSMCRQRVDMTQTAVSNVK